MNEQQIPTSEVLHRAADLIETRGWTSGPGGWGGSRAGLCLEGAIAAAAGLVCGDSLDPHVVNHCPAGSAVRQYLALGPVIFDRTTGCVDDGEPLWRWNDHASGGRDRVIEVLRATAAVERAREDAAALVPTGGAA